MNYRNGLIRSWEILGLLMVLVACSGCWWFLAPSDRGLGRDSILQVETVEPPQAIRRAIEQEYPDSKIIETKAFSSPGSEPVFYAVDLELANGIKHKVEVNPTGEIRP